MSILPPWLFLVIAFALPAPAVASAGAWVDSATGQLQDGRGDAENGEGPSVLSLGRELPGEIVVLDAEAAFLAEVIGLGFRVIEHRPLGTLGITVTRLSVPRHLTVASAQLVLRERYPDLRAASNALYRPQAAPKFRDAAAAEPVSLSPR